MSLALSLPTLSLLLSAGAMASGLDSPSVGSAQSGPAIADAAAVYWNPARLAGLRAPEAQLGAAAIFGRLGYDRVREGVYPAFDGLVYADPEPSQLDPSRTGPAETVHSPIAAGTGDLFLAAPVQGTPLGVGGGVYVPYAAPLRFPYDGPQRWALQQVFLAVAQADFGVGVRLHPRVELGATAGYVLGYASLARQQDLAALGLMSDLLGNPPIGQPNDFGPAAPTTVREQEVLSREVRLRHQLSHSATFKVGLHTIPHDRVSLGFVYDFGSPLSFRGPFQLDTDDPFFTDDLAGRGVDFPRRVEGRSQLAFRAPMRLRGAIGVQASDTVRVDLVAEGVLWSSLEAFHLTLTSDDLILPDLGQGDTTSVAIQRRWHDAVHLTARTLIDASPRVTVGVAVGYHSPASPDSTVDVASPDGHRLLGTLSAAFDVGRHQRVTLLPELSIQGILPRTVTTSDFDLANGQYRLWIGSAGLRARVGFGKSRTQETPG